MAVLLWILAVVLAVVAVVQLLQGHYLLGLLLLVVGCLVGPGGSSVLRGRPRS